MSIRPDDEQKPAEIVKEILDRQGYKSRKEYEDKFVYASVVFTACMVAAGIVFFVYLIGGFKSGHQKNHKSIISTQHQ